MHKNQEKNWVVFVSVTKQSERFQLQTISDGNK